MQKLAKTSTYLITLIWLGIVLSTLENYFYSISEHINATFHFSPDLFDWLYAISGAFAGLIAITVSYWGNRIHRPAWIGGTSSLLSICCYLVTVPYLQPPTNYQEDNITVVYRTEKRLCERLTMESIELIGDAGGALMLVCMVGLLVFLAIANVSYWSHGISYLDQNSDETKTPLYIALIIISRTVSIKNGTLITLTLKNNPERWWIPMMVLGGLLLASGSVMACFPRKLLDTILKQAAASILDIASGNSTENLAEFQIHIIKMEEKFWPTFKRIIINKVVMLNTLALSMSWTGIIQFHMYENAFLQSQYHIPYTNDSQNPWTSRLLSTLFKGPTIIFVVLIIGLVYSKFTPSAVKVMKFNFSALIVITLIFISFIFMRCKTISIAGEVGGRYVTPLCSYNCRCLSEEVIFQPVCIVEGSATYFSPCHAGCTAFEEVNNVFMYRNCSCGPNPNYILSDVESTTYATNGACDNNNCFIMWTLFQLLYITLLSLYSSTFVGYVLVSIRSVRSSDKSLAIGMLITGVGIIAYVPGYLGYRAISDKFCRFRNVDQYNCNLHSSEYSTYLSGITAILTFASAIVTLLVWFSSRNLDLFDYEAYSYGIDYNMRGPGAHATSYTPETQPLNEVPSSRNEEVNVYRPEIRTTRI